MALPSSEWSAEEALNATKPWHPVDTGRHVTRSMLLSQVLDEDGQNAILSVVEHLKAFILSFLFDLLQYRLIPMFDNCNYSAVSSMYDTIHKDSNQLISTILQHCEKYKCNPSQLLDHMNKIWYYFYYKNL